MHVNLKNLAQATEQQIFDQVAQHLIKQGRQCSNQAGACLYRHNGMKCAAGALIDDNEYKPEMDQNGMTWGMLVDAEIAPVQHRYLVGSLQALHDGRHSFGYVPALRSFAKTKGLVFNEEWVKLSPFSVNG